MGVRLDAAGDYLRRTANLPNVASVTIAGWACLDVDKNDFTNICTLEDSASNAGNSINLITDSDGTTLKIYSGSSAYSATLATLTVGTPFFFALTGGAANAVVGYYRAAGSNTLASVNHASSGFTSAAMYFGNDSYAYYLNGRLFNLKVWDRVLTPAELLIESFYARPMFPANLNLWAPVNSTADVADRSGNARDLTIGGTLANEDNGVALWVPRRKLFVPAASGGGGLASAGVAQQSSQAQAGARVASVAAAQEPGQAASGAAVGAAGAGHGVGQQSGGAIVRTVGTAQAAAQAAGGATAGIAASGTAQQPSQAEARAGIVGGGAAQTTGQASSSAAVTAAGSAQDPSPTSGGATVRALGADQAAAQAAGALAGSGVATVGEAEAAGQASAPAAVAAVAAAQEPGQAEARIFIAAAGVSAAPGQGAGSASIASAVAAQAPGQTEGAQPQTITAFGVSVAAAQAAGAVASDAPAPEAPASQGSMGSFRTRRRGKPLPLKPLEDEPQQLDLPMIASAPACAPTAARSATDEAAHRSVVEALCRAAELLLEAED